MKHARTLQLPTGMAMTFVCSPIRPSDPALDPVVQAAQAQSPWEDPLSEERDEPEPPPGP
jgi:hypothetical protein